MDRVKLLDKVKKDIRAILISAPLGVPAHIFAKDYRQMNGREIPFRELGHRDLDSFIFSLPDVIRIGTGPTGLVTFYPVVTDDTKHIVNMIRKQKKPSIKKAVIPSSFSSRKTPVKMTSFSRRGGHGARFTPRGGMCGNRHQGFLPPLPPPSVSLLSPPPFLPSYPSQPPHLPLRPPTLPTRCFTSSLLHLDPHRPHIHSSHPHTSLLDPTTSHFDSPPLAHNHLIHTNHPTDPLIRINHPTDHLIHTNHPTDHLIHTNHPTDHFIYPSIYSHDRPLFPFPPPFPPSFHPSSHPSPPPLIPHPPPPPLPPHPHTHPCSSIFPWCNGPPSSPPAKYNSHPRSYSQPGSYPNLPPRLQKHQHSATYSHPHPCSGPPLYISTSVVSRGSSSRPHPGGASSQSGGGGGGATMRPRLSSVPENSGNRLHPQHTLNMATNPGGSDAVSSGGSGSMSDLWKDEFRAACHMTIEEMNTWAHNKKREPISDLVCLEGVASRQREDVFMDKKVLKILLSSSSNRRGRPADGNWAPAVQLHFISPFWNLLTHRAPYDVPEGARLKVYGQPFAAFIKTKDKYEAAMRVLYFERVSEGSSTSNVSSAHTSPQRSRSTTPKMGADVNYPELEENIFKMLMKFEKGTYAKRLGKVYQAEFKDAPPDNLLEIARNFPFVLMETFSAETEIMHLKEEYRRRGSLHPPPVAPPVQPTPPPPPLPETATFADPEKLYDVFVCLVNNPFSFYVLISDGGKGTQQAKFTDMEDNMNKYFSSKKPTKVVGVKENDLCACLWRDEEEGRWCRALVISVHDSMANVLFPDYGNQDCVAVSDLYTLPPQFYQLPFQAIHCSLHGVLREEKMTGPEVDDYFTDLASDKICALQVVDCSGARASVEILDTELDDDETINSKLITKFHPIASLSPQLPAPGEPMVAVKLADIDEHGQLSMQVAGPGLTKLEELANQIEERYSGSRGREMEVAMDGIYCAEYRLDHSWYRVKVLKLLPERKVLVEYVDYGNEEEVERTNLRPKLDTPLFSLPPQIVKCTMAGIPKGPWSSDAIDYLARYIQVDELNLEVVDYCVKVGGGVSMSFPVAKLHVKNSEQEMVCINEDMLIDPALFGSLSQSESLPSGQGARTSSSLSSAEQVNSHRRVVAPAARSLSVSSAPVFADVSSEAESDTVFVSGQSQILNCSSSALDSKNTSPSGGKTGGVQMDTLHVSLETSSISSLNETSSSNAESDKSEQGSPQRQTGGGGVGTGGKLELVHSPKECIRDGVPYVASSEEALKSGHLAAPPSGPSPSSSSSSATPLGSSLSPSVIPTTPPVSPPPLSDDGPETNNHREWGNKWAELPRGKAAVEVEVTWSSSPTNFTLLLLSNKQELDSMAGQLQWLVQSQPLPRHLSPGSLCAAKYSLDSQWYRAIVKQRFGTQIEVEFLDYGGSEMLPLSSIKCLPQKCRDLPFQAIKASLYGVNESVTQTLEMVKKFENIVSGKRLYALKKEENDLKSSVTLVDTSSEHDVVINNEFC